MTVKKITVTALPTGVVKQITVTALAPPPPAAAVTKKITVTAYPTPYYIRVGIQPARMGIQRPGGMEWLTPPFS